jgi:bidirectional [NiFe] hydrogenase diaphorase subunit
MEHILLREQDIPDIKSYDVYVEHGGFEALRKAVTMQPGEVIDEVKASNLRGRGGAGYPTGLKWSTVAKAISEQKYVVCNADEGDPGAFMDRAVLESDPHRVLEGMLIAGYAINANRGFIYVRAEYPLAIERLKNAIRQAKRMHLLGENILGSDFNFDIEIRLGAGAYVCGEETALMSSIEGKRGTPRPRPPYPADHGLWGEPTLINNVETWANVPPIIRKGGEWFASIGTENSKGTKVFALAGQVRNTGLIEVPMGTSLDEIVNAIGSGTPDGSPIKAVQTGGPTGGCIPFEYFDTPVDYASLGKLGSIMGSGGMIVMNNRSSMVEVAKYFMEFCMTESCGKCIPCRVGTAQMYNLLEKISTGKGTLSDLDLLEQLCDLTRNASLCGLGQSAPNPIMSTLRYFRDEYLALIADNQAEAAATQGEES